MRRFAERRAAAPLARAAASSGGGGGASAPYDPIVNEAGAVLEIDFSQASTVTSTASVANGSDFTNASWTKNDCTATADQDGTADRITVGVAPTSVFVSSALTNVQSSSTQVPLVLTIQAKYENIPWLIIESRSGTANNRTWFDIQNGVVGTNGANHSGASISAADGSGYRTISVQVNVNAGTNIHRFYLSTVDALITAPAAGTTVLVKAATATQNRVTSAVNRVSSVAWASPSVTLELGYDATGFNGFPCGHMYKTQYLLSTEAAVFGAVTDAHAYTLFLVWATDEADIDRCVFGVGNSGVATNGTRYWGQSSTTTGRWTCHETNDAASTVNVDSAGATDLNPHVQEWFSPGTTVSLQTDGAAADPSGTAQDPGTTTPNNSAIGCRPDSSPDTFGNGRVLIVALWNVQLDAAARSRVRQYYAARGGVTVAP